MTAPQIIAIDGPAASGKSTLGQALADYLDYLYFDTGVMYRAVTLVALQRGVDFEDEAACTQIAREIHIDVQPPSKDDGRPSDVLIDGEDKTWDIRQSEVDAKVPLVSTYPGVREALTQQQRRIGLQGKVVMVGRDIGTIVIPEAPVKIYLVASPEERARRRYHECLARGEEVTFEEVLDSMRRRDRIDTNRTLAPLRPAEDAEVIDSDEWEAEEVFERAKVLLEQSDPKALA